MEKSELENLNQLVKKEQELFYRMQAAQYMPDKHRFAEERSKVLKQIEHIRAKRDAERKKGEEEEKNEYIRHNHRNFRCVIGSAAEHLMHGTFTLDVVASEMLTPQSTEFEIVAVSGNKIKIDLLKLLSPSSLNMLIAKAFSPIYFVVEPSGAYQRGKRLGIWNNSGDWEASRGIQYKPQTVIAILRV